MNRIIALLLALCCVFSIMSCGGAETGSDAGNLTAGLFDLSDAEIDAFENSAEIVSTGVPAGDVDMWSSTAPVMPGSASAGAATETTQTETRSASTFGGSKDKCKKHSKKGCWTCKWKKCDKCKKVSCDRKDDCDKCGKCHKRDCKKKNKCEPEHPKCDCVGICNFSERFWATCDCTATTADVTYAAKVVFTDPECGKCDKSGVDVTFSRDGQVVGTAKTNADGWAYFTEIAVPMGSWVITVSSKCGDATFTADLRVVVYNNCYHGCISGKGKLPSKNGGKYAVFSYELHVNDGHLTPNNFSFADAPLNAVNALNTWMVIVGNEAHFGDGEYYFRAVNNGTAPGVDYFSIDHWASGYHNEGNLLNGQLRHSYGYYEPLNLP